MICAPITVPSPNMNKFQVRENGIVTSKKLEGRRVASLQLRLSGVSVLAITALKPWSRGTIWSQKRGAERSFLVLLGIPFSTVAPGNYRRGEVEERQEGQLKPCIL